jgi:hypothetical protein
VTIELTVARNADEAQRIARGEGIGGGPEEGEQPPEEAETLAEPLLEPEAIEARRTKETPPEAPEADAKTARKSR